MSVQVACLCLSLCLWANADAVGSFSNRDIKVEQFFDNVMSSGNPNDEVYEQNHSCFQFHDRPKRQHMFQSVQIVLLFR